MSAVRAARVLSAVRAGYGLLLLVRPERSPEVLLGDTRDPAVPPVVRVLGARHAAQGLVTLVRPTETVLGLGAGVDALHAASMVALAAVSPAHRRPGLVSAGAASVFAAASGVLARRGR